MRVCSWAGQQDCVQSEGKLYLIFEFVDRDLKKYMEATQGMLDPMLVKVCFTIYSCIVAESVP